jgi:hypothetical protein
MFALRLDNPHPEREIGSIALEATGKDGTPVLFFALTIEPVAVRDPTHPDTP